MRTTTVIALAAAAALVPLSAGPAAAENPQSAPFDRVNIPWTGGATITLVDRDVAVPGTPETYFGKGEVTATSERGPSPQVAVQGRSSDIPCPSLQTGLLHITAKTFGRKFSGTVKIFAYTNTALDGSLMDDDRALNGQFVRAVKVAYDDTNAEGPQTTTLLKICVPRTG